MKYQFFITWKVQENNWVVMGEKHVIPWDVRDLISASSGWFIVNEGCIGKASVMIPMLQKGLTQLTDSAVDYADYETRHGLGTIENVRVFYESLLRDCMRYPNYELCGSMVK